MGAVSIVRQRSNGDIYYFIVSGTLEIRDKFGHSVNQITGPFSNASDAILNNALGVKESLTCSLLLLYRTDDYRTGSTSGTGYPISSPYSPAEQKKFIREWIMLGKGKHILTDHNGVTYQGRISDLEFLDSGDNPLSIPVVFNFNVGKVLVY